MKRAVHLAIFFIAALAIAGLIAGCGNSSSDLTPAQSLTSDSGAGASTVMQGASATVTDASYSSADLPLADGTLLQYASNRAGAAVQVYFDLEGPWKFTSGPQETTLKVATARIDTAPQQQEFPNASVSTYSYWASASSSIRSASGSEYLFQGKDDSAWTIYGRVTADGRAITYSNPSKALAFPLTAGESWTDSYTETDDNGKTDVIAENTVLARNRLTVPAGSFDAWLLQTKISSKTRGETITSIDYSWFVPGIGRAAEIISLPGERNPNFSSARAFYRLKSYQ